MSINIDTYKQLIRDNMPKVKISPLADLIRERVISVDETIITYDENV